MPIGPGELNELQNLVGTFMLSYRDDYFSFFKRLYDHLKSGGQDWFGDMDFSYKIVHEGTTDLLSVIDNHDKYGEKKTIAILCKNSCTCSDECRWLMVYSADIVNDKASSEELHVRIIYDRGDYPKSQYPEKLNLKFWKDRNFVVDYVEKHHMTNLGGVYGDIRDKGYVISYERRNEDQMDAFSRMKDETQLHYFYNSFTHFTSMLHSTDIEIEERLKKTFKATGAKNIAQVKKYRKQFEEIMRRPIKMPKLTKEQHAKVAEDLGKILKAVEEK